MSNKNKGDILYAIIIMLKQQQYVYNDKIKVKDSQ